MIKSTRRGIIHLALALAASTAMGTFATTAAQAQDKILLIINGALGDKSFFDSAAKGMKMIKDRYGDDVETKILEIGDDPTKWEPVFLDASEQDWDLIIGGTYQMSETVGSVAQQYPDKKYILYDASVPYEEGGYDNVYSIQYKQNEGSYLGGMLAASLLKEGKLGDTGKNLGFLGGMDIPVINDFLVGYIAGAQAIQPDAKIAISYAGSFMDAAKGKASRNTVPAFRSASSSPHRPASASFPLPRKPANMSWASIPIRKRSSRTAIRPSPSRWSAPS